MFPEQSLTVIRIENNRFMQMVCMKTKDRGDGFRGHFNP